MIRSAICSLGVVLISLGLATGLRAGEVPTFAFVSRDLANSKPLTRTEAIVRAASGKLLVREPDGTVRSLVDAAAQGAVPGAVPSIPVDVSDPDVHWDGTRLVFAGYSADESAWRIYEIRADGSGLRQLTTSDRQLDLSRFGEAAELFRSYDDVDPCYLPDGRICFVSTRYPGVAPDIRLRATNLYVMGKDGEGLHRITTERFGADTPAVDPVTGRIVYSRWWRTPQAGDLAGTGNEIPPGSPGYDGGPGAPAVDPNDVVVRPVTDKEFAGVNSWFLSEIHPDGTNLAMFTGFKLSRTLTQAYRPSFLANGDVLALFIPQTPFLSYPRGNGLRRYQRGPSTPKALGGPQIFDSELNRVKLPERTFASAVELADGRLLVTSTGPADAVLDYGVYLQNGDGSSLAPFFDLPGTAELDAVPLVVRAVPPVVQDRNKTILSDEVPSALDEALAQGGSFIFKVENIHANAAVDVAIASAPPIGQKLAIEFFMNPQRTSTVANDPPILIKSVVIPPDGKLEVELPAGVPLFEVLRLPNGSIPRGRDGQIFHVGGMNFGRAGETARCVGCHAGHSQMKVPDDSAWTNIAPSATVTASSTRSINDISFRAGNLVDRSTLRRIGEWASSEGVDASIQLTWPTRIRAREIRLYGPQLNSGSFGKREQVIKRARLTGTAGGVRVAAIEVAGNLSPAGTVVVWDPKHEIDGLQVSIDARDVEGIYEGTRSTALAEIEVLGQEAAVAPPVATFRRGDADCSGRQQVTDAISILSFLFQGGAEPCCMAAGDVNADQNITLTDSLVLLRFLFQGGPVPPAPFELCGAQPVGSTLSCALGTCR